MKDEAIDLELLGFDDTELDRLLATQLEPDEVPEPPANPSAAPAISGSAASTA